MAAWTEEAHAHDPNLKVQVTELGPGLTEDIQSIEWASGGVKFNLLPRLACLVGWVYSLSLIFKEKPWDNERNRGGLTALSHTALRCPRNSHFELPCLPCLHSRLGLLATLTLGAGVF